MRSKPGEWKTCSSFPWMGYPGWRTVPKRSFQKSSCSGVIVHLIRNSIKYVPTKDYKKYTTDLKRVYVAANLKAGRAAFDTFCENWKQYPVAVDVWKRNFQHVEQLYDYGSAVRKVMYTTNAIESVNSSFRKVTKKAPFRTKTPYSNCCIFEVRN